MNPQNNQPYDYIQSGFDSFLSCSIDNAPQLNLDSQGPMNSAIRYDDHQVSGFLGDTLQVGNVQINRDNITMSDDETVRLVIGKDEGGFSE